MVRGNAPKMVYAATASAGAEKMQPLESNSLTSTSVKVVSGNAKIQTNANVAICGVQIMAAVKMVSVYVMILKSRTANRLELAMCVKMALLFVISEMAVNAVRGIHHIMVAVSTISAIALTWPFIPST